MQQRLVLVAQAFERRSPDRVLDEVGVLAKFEDLGRSRVVGAIPVLVRQAVVLQLERFDLLLHEQVLVAEFIDFCAELGPLVPHSWQGRAQGLTLLHGLVAMKLLLQTAPDDDSRVVRIVSTFQTNDLGRAPSVPLDESAPMSDLLRKLRDFLLVRVEERFELSESRRLLLVKVAGLVVRLLGAVRFLKDVEESQLESERKENSTLTRCRLSISTS